MCSKRRSVNEVGKDSLAVPILEFDIKHVFRETFNDDSF